MTKTINYNGENIFFALHRYANNDNLAIEMITEGLEPYATLTVNLDFVMPGYAFIDTNNLRGIEEFLQKNKFGKKTAERKSGFVTYPLYKIDLQKLQPYVSQEDSTY